MNTVYVPMDITGDKIATNGIFGNTAFMHSLQRYSAWTFRRVQIIFDRLIEDCE